MDLRSLSAFFVYVSGVVHRMRYVIAVAGLLVIMEWGADISAWVSRAWRSEGVGERLRRECESIVKEGGEGLSYPGYREQQIRHCIMRRGQRLP